MGSLRRIRPGVAVVLALGLVLAACGGDDGGDGASDTGTGGSESPAADGTPLTVVTPGVLSSLDSERYQGFVSIDLLPNVSGTLLRFKEPEAGATTLQAPDQIEGELVESWEMADDQSSVTMVLRDDVVSSQGNPLDSEDVRWSVERMSNSEGVPIASILMEIGGWDLENPVEVVDDKTFTVNFAAPNAVSLSVMTTFFMTIYDSEDVIENAGADDPWGYDYLAEHSSSFGPYMVESFDPGNEVRLVANPNYHDEAPEISNVIVRSVPEGSSRLQLVQTGEVDIAMALTFDQLASLEDDSRVRLEQVLYPNIDVLVPNVTIEPFDDPLVRQALAYAIDRDAILGAAYQGLGSASTDFFHDAFGAPEIDENLSYDPDKARDLLAQAGLADGFDMAVAYNEANLGAHIEQVGVLLKAQLADVGINVELRNIPTAADFDAAKRDGSLTAWLATSLPLVPDPAYYLQVFYSTGGLTNLQGYSSDVVDGLSRQILETQPGDERDALISEVNEFMMGDMPAVPIVDTQKFFVFSPNVEGFLSYPQGHINYRDLTRS